MKHAWLARLVHWAQENPARLVKSTLLIFGTALACLWFAGEFYLEVRDLVEDAPLVKEEIQELQLDVVRVQEQLAPVHLNVTELKDDFTVLRSDLTELQVNQAANHQELLWELKRLQDLLAQSSHDSDGRVKASAR